MDVLRSAGEELEKPRYEKNNRCCEKEAMSRETSVNLTLSPPN